jgi:hypothetical protein
VTDVWESAWERLSESFRRVASSLGSSYPDMTWSSGHSDNKAFPFRVYAAFNRGHTGSEDVVASVDFHRSSDSGLRFSSDIGFDDGNLLTDGPSGIIHTGQGLLAARAEIEAAVKDIAEFLERSEPMLREAIERQ